VLDVGAGLCNLIKLPDGKFIIYDAGHYNGKGIPTLKQIEAFIPHGSEIELMILSHTDGDHIGAAGGIIESYRVKQLLWGGYEKSFLKGGKPTASYQRLVDALKKHPETKNINLHDQDSTINPGTTITFDDVNLTVLCGFGSPPQNWDIWKLDDAEKINSVSIVIKLEYRGNSILFCGDAVGRHRDDPENALIATENYLVHHASAFLKSNVIIAPHHGARNGSSKAFVQAVHAETVIFSAGHKFRHPTERTAREYLQVNANAKIFRTDRGDDEGIGEWDFLRIENCTDPFDDDNIEIVLKSDGTYDVFYLNPLNTCTDVGYE